MPKFEGDLFAIPDHVEVDFDDLDDDQKNQYVKTVIEAVRMWLPPRFSLFELFGVRVEFQDPDDIGNTEVCGKLFGYIEVKYKLGAVSYFDRLEHEAVPICNNGWVPLTGPDPPRCASASERLEVDVELYVRIAKDKKALVLSNLLLSWDYSDSVQSLALDQTVASAHEGQDGRVILYNAAFEYAVQATVKAKLLTDDDSLFQDVYGSIVAYYGKFHYTCMPEDQPLYHVTLFELPKDKHGPLNIGEDIQLSRTVVAVRARRSLIIKANFWDFKNDCNVILEGTLEVPAGSVENDQSKGLIKGENCQIELTVDWYVEPTDYEPLVG